MTTTSVFANRCVRDRQRFQRFSLGRRRGDATSAAFWVCQFLNVDREVDSADEPVAELLVNQAVSVEPWILTIS
jgi:hypothetical protein